MLIPFLRLSDQAAGILMLVVSLAIMGAVLAIAFKMYFRTLRLEREREERMRIGLRSLADEPTSKATHEDLISLARQSPRLAETIYPAALIAVEETNGYAATKRFALDIGRIMHGHARGNGRPTTYDEQAIQNDITSRVTAA